MDKITNRVLLFDFYGGLLTEKQQSIYDLYFQQDFSLGEIAEVQEVSRNAVYDLLQRTNRALDMYEEKLCLVSKYGKMCEILTIMQEKIASFEKNNPGVLMDDFKDLLAKLEDVW